MARGVAGYNYVRRVRAGKGGGGYEYGGDVGTGEYLIFFKTLLAISNTILYVLTMPTSDLLGQSGTLVPGNLKNP